MLLSTSASEVIVPRPTLAELYASHAPRVMRWATRLLGDSQDAGDVTQEVFLIAQQRLARFSSREATIDSWLFRITENVVRNRRRSARRKAVLFGQPAPGAEPVSPSPMPDDALQARRSAQLVASVLDRLSATDRKLLVLFELEGHPGEEVALMLGLPASVIWVRLHRARARFSKELEALAPGEGP